ncbi:hypothetical protein KQ939_17015 [Planococcus sp. CP5-4]|uniref:hypothetical protein n=1 Tax=unclassified Planococcus (in: firmicutes) TaxID=2662419 RepID=UPI001C22FA1F|nr:MULTISPECIES: hypothetical protein [unclassified Planococcus (in: firmicutes)]MBU9674797.1 hypothetical protein [Planococcus sp. CP5-4_YE]MBV0910570.1 hypothetical protein [Planococcus sp. CP5-4_UN]MBW6065377.1 hypothetical protein [Planococcus sp. CP5-4]
MSAEISNALLVLLGIILGEITPSVGKFIDTQINQSYNLKEKHESIIRTLLNDYFPERITPTSQLEDTDSITAV